MAEALELIGARTEALYAHDENGRIVSLNQWDGGEAPRFYLGRGAQGNIWRFRADVPDDVAAELERLCREEPVLPGIPPTPMREEEYFRLLSPAPRIWAGPAFRFPTGSASDVATVPITEGNADILRGGMDDWLPDVPHRRPFMALVVDGRAVSVCASVRISDSVHEAGVETVPAYRRTGYAANVVAGWAAAVRETGAEPIYSTSWSNAASLAVARRLGLEMIGVDYHVT